ncbi:MAG: DUF86 domain-containing protein [Chloroflexi bacterium]|nr:DUF86 domain-containing protein [Chloroflexota bacterium]
MKDQDKDNSVYLLHILDAIGQIEAYTAEGRADFLGSQLQQHAVIWNVGVIGEASRHISQRFRDLHPEVHWREIVSMRNRLVHQYFNVDPHLVWEVVSGDVPILKSQVEAMLDELQESAGS